MAFKLFLLPGMGGAEGSPIARRPAKTMFLSPSADDVYQPPRHEDEFAHGLAAQQFLHVLILSLIHV